MAATTTILCATFALLAATVSVAAAAGAEGGQAALGVSATVVRPVDIASPVITDESAVVVVSNSANVEILADGAVVSRADGDTVTITGGRSGAMRITIIY
jgi:hypothetical protein